MSVEPKTVQNLFSSCYPKGQIVSKTGGNVSGFDIYSKTNINHFAKGSETRVFCITKDPGNEESTDMVVVQKYEDVPDTAIFALLVVCKKDESNDVVIESVSDIVESYISEYLDDMSYNNIPLFTSAIIRETVGDGMVMINSITMKSVPYDPDTSEENYHVFAIMFDSSLSTYKTIYMNEIEENEEANNEYYSFIDVFEEQMSKPNKTHFFWNVCYPKLGELNSENMCQILSSSMERSRGNNLVLNFKTMSEKIERKLPSSSGMGSSTGHKSSMASESNIDCSGYLKVVKSNPDSSINNIGNVAAILEKLSELVRNPGDEKRCVDFYKKATKSQFLKFGSPTNVKLGFSKFPNSVDEIDSMVFDDVCSENSKFVVTITANDFKQKLDVKKMSDKALTRQILICVVKEFVRMMFQELFNVEEIDDERYDEIFNEGKINAPSHETTKSSANVHTFNSTSSSSSKKVSTLASKLKLGSSAGQMSSDKKSKLAGKLSSGKAESDSSSGIKSMSTNFNFKSKLKTGGSPVEEVSSVAPLKSVNEIEMNGIPNSWDLKCSVKLYFAVIESAVKFNSLVCYAQNKEYLALYNKMSSDSRSDSQAQIILPAQIELSDVFVPHGTLANNCLEESLTMLIDFLDGPLGNKWKVTSDLTIFPHGYSGSIFINGKSMKTVLAETNYPGFDHKLVSLEDANYSSVVLEIEEELENKEYDSNALFESLKEAFKPNEEEQSPDDEQSSNEEQQSESGSTKKMSSLTAKLASGNKMSLKDKLSGGKSKALSLSSSSSSSNQPFEGSGKKTLSLALKKTTSPGSSETKKPSGLSSLISKKTLGAKTSAEPSPNKTVSSGLSRKLESFKKGKNSGSSLSTLGSSLGNKSSETAKPKTTIGKLKLKKSEEKIMNDSDTNHEDSDNEDSNLVENSFDKMAELEYDEDSPEDIRERFAMDSDSDRSESDSEREDEDENEEFSHSLENDDDLM